MSDPVRIAAAVEGPTDAIVLRAILSSVLTDREFEFQTLQPEGSAAFGSEPLGETGAGWVGVYRWSRQSAREGGGSVSGSSVLDFHDVLIVHVDADVAGKTYSSGGIRDAGRQDLPCEMPCPPPAATTNAMQAVILGWLGEPVRPLRVVLCTPSKSTEAWVLAAICLANRMVARDDWECRPDPEGQLGTWPKGVRFSKRPEDYRSKGREIAAAWPNVSARLSEAGRFDREVRAAVPIS
jgi:hypothetical protein